jgi:hypothetical protein
MPFTYKSGMDIRCGDRVKLHVSPGVVQFVVAGRTGDPAVDWSFEGYDDGELFL